MKQPYVTMYTTEGIRTFLKFCNQMIDLKLHREDGPAIIYHSPVDDCHQSWFRNNSLHRIDGPARVWDNKKPQYYLNGLRYLKPTYDLIVEEVLQLGVPLGLVDDREWVRDYYRSVYNNELKRNERSE